MGQEACRPSGEGPLDRVACRRGLRAGPGRTSPSSGGGGRSLIAGEALVPGVKDLRELDVAEPGLGESVARLGRLPELLPEPEEAEPAEGEVVVVVLGEEGRVSLGLVGGRGRGRARGRGGASCDSGSRPSPAGRRRRRRRARSAARIAERVRSMSRTSGMTIELTATATSTAPARSSSSNIRRARNSTFAASLPSRFFALVIMPGAKSTAITRPNLPTRWGKSGRSRSRGRPR